MFAPYCPTCAGRVLLGTRRIVTADLSVSPAIVMLLCFCGTAVPHDNPVPQCPEAASRPTDRRVA